MKKTERQASRPTGSSKASSSTERRLSGGASGSDSPTGMQSAENLSLTEIKELIGLISEKEFNEFELELGDFRLRLQKGATIVPAVSPEPSPVIAAAPPAATVPATPLPAEEKLHLVTSPIVGTFYRSPSPTSESFVKLGDSVEVGKTLCIIEAMKLMNEIQSDAAGTVAKIFVENGQPVEYGQPLFGLSI